ncbi:hypothetical protein PybrP1_006718 [[Pythium] brassicae (nom. inval.)]|nr:hypothetical protein PybrP1_006718 [[Pythium] brassicae (nom. inval.)]
MSSSSAWQAAHAKWTWMTAVMTVAVASMAFALVQQQKRRRALLFASPSDSRAQPTTRGLEPRRRRRTSSLAPPVRHSSSGNGVDGLSSETPSPTISRPGLRLGHGVWGFLLAPVVAEAICFVGGLAVIHLARIGREYEAVGLLVAIFLFRLKSAAFTTAFAPLSENSKIHLLKGLDRETLHELLQEDLPRWVKFPDVEKCDWLNQTIDSLWPYVKVAIARSVKDALTPVLDGIKPKLLMSELGFSGLDLGTAAPVINGIKTQKHLEEQVVVDVDLLFATQNTDIVFAFRNPGSPVSMSIELSDFLLRGTLRVELKPLFPRWPTVGAVSVSFTETPTVNFNLSTLYVNWMGLPALSSVFRSAICSAIESRAVWPNKIVVPLVQDLSKVEMEALGANRPLGMLVVKNLQLSGVVPANPVSRWTGLHSFQVQLSAGKEKAATELVHGQTAHDFEDECFHLLVRDPKTQDLSLSLEYKEALRQLRLIDSKWIHLDHLAPLADSREIVAFGRDGVGQAEFDLAWYPFAGTREAARRRASSDARSLLPEDIACMGAVFIKLYRCERLTPMDFNGSSDPYVVFRVGSRSKQSSVKSTTLNPIWDPPEQLELLVSNDRHDTLSVVVMDSDFLKTDDEIGHVEIPLAQLQRNDRFTKTWLLGNNSGSITLELEWKGF